MFTIGLNIMMCLCVYIFVLLALPSMDDFRDIMPFVLQKNLSYIEKRGVHLQSCTIIE